METKIFQPTEKWIQNYTQNHVCMTSTYLFALCALSGHTPDETMDDLLGGSPPRPGSGH